MKRTPLYITVREDHTTVIDSHPGGFPVDGDALHDHATLRRRAETRIADDAGLVLAARTWLGDALDPAEPPLTDTEVSRVIASLFPGGAPRFVAIAPTLQKIQAAA